MELQLSYYKNALDNKGTTIDLEQVLLIIQRGSLENPTQELRNMPNGKERDHFKKTSFPAVTWSGVFAKRRASDLQRHTGLLCADIDKLQPAQLRELRMQLMADPHVFLLFISPSGNGLKVIFKTSTDAALHANYFAAIAAYMLQTYEVDIDQSGKDVSRLCFLCHDADMFVSHSSLPFLLVASNDTTVTAMEPITEKKLTKPQQKTFESIGTSLNDVFEFTQKLYAYAEGSRNNFLFHFGMNASRKGFDESDTLNFAYGFASDLAANEVKATIHSSYNKTASDGTHGKFQHKPKNNNGGNVTKNGQASKGVQKQSDGSTPSLQSTPNTKHQTEQEQENEEEYPTDIHFQENGDVKFWYEIVTKQVHDKATDTMKDIKKTCINQLAIKFFLEQKHFGRYELDNGFDYVQKNAHRIKIIDMGKIIDYLYKYLKANNEWKAYSALMTGSKQFLGTDKLRVLDYIEVNIPRDTRDTVFLYFNNSIVEVTKDAITTKSYEDFGMHIWDRQAIDHNIKIESFDYLNPDFWISDTQDKNEQGHVRWKCEFAEFIWHVACGARNEEDQVTDTKILRQRYQSFITSIGYLLDGYKHPSERKGIFAVDRKGGDADERNGRSGKSLIAQAAMKLKVVSFIDGPNYDPRYQFRYEPITADTQIVCYNEMQKNHDVGQEFTIIADNYTVNRRNIGNLYFPYSQSPKVYYTTNFVPKGNGSSFTGRMHIIEASDFFNGDYTPYQHFGHALLSDEDWDEAQWNLFYNFMIYCIQVYKRDGLVQYPDGNFLNRKLSAECPEDFISWLDARNDEDPAIMDYINVKRNGWVEKKKLMDNWNKEATELNMQKSSAKQVYGMIKKYCRSKNLGFYTKKSNGVETYWLGETIPSPMVSTIKAIVPAPGTPQALQVEQKEMF